MSRTNESATSPMITADRSRLPECVGSLCSDRTTRHAGRRPRMAASASPANAENAKTLQSMDVEWRRGRFAGANTSNPRTAIQATPMPSSVLKPAIRSASASICRLNRPARAPNATRTAISRSRNDRRTSRRFATFPHAISRRRMTAPNIASKAGRTSFMRVFCQNPAFTCARALSRVTPGRKCAITCCMSASRFGAS